MINIFCINDSYSIYPNMLMYIKKPQMYIKVFGSVKFSKKLSLN